MRVPRGPSVETVYLDIHVEAPQKKGMVTVTLDEAYQRPLLVLDAQGPSKEGVMYMTLGALKGTPKRTRTKWLKKCNLAVPVTKMAQMVKAYPRYVGTRKCHGLLQVTLTDQVLTNLRRTINLKLHKNAIKVGVGNTQEAPSLLAARTKQIVQKLNNEGYKVLAVRKGTTQGGSALYTYE